MKQLSHRQHGPSDREAVRLATPITRRGTRQLVCPLSRSIATRQNGGIGRSPDRLHLAGAGRERKGGFGAIDGKKEPFVH